MTAHITLQTSHGEFDPAFLKQLPVLERAMLEQGLDPSDFIIAKHDAQGARLPIFYRPDGNPAEYTVFVRGRSFTVTQPDDLSFLSYFYRLCVPAPEEDDDLGSFAHTVHSAERKFEALIVRLERWFNKPI